MSASFTDRAIEPRPSTPRWVKVFGILILAGLAVVVGMMVSGGQHGPGMHTGQTDASSLSSPSITGSPAGSPADASDASRTLVITARDTMSFEPERLSVAAGEVVTFIVTNGDQVPHEFTLGDAAMQAEHAAAMDHIPTAGMTHELPNSIAVEPGETKQLTWRFGAAGTLEYACHEPGHFDAGMRGLIIVG